MVGATEAAKYAAISYAREKRVYCDYSQAERNKSNEPKVHAHLAIRQRWY
jgi:hypothetical protein